ncbi:hypothetical protein [Enhygromyxa salina]|uniref:hypothetical protein n=1 Tax=Enhygromyxa salina TaxID=215803 RepID=UPI000D03230F|nr:hypothetical protein [Enhygromyxa salina]
MPSAGQGLSSHTRLEPRARAWRAVPVALVFLSGFLGLSSGVEVSERELSEVGYWAKAYALGLFVVGGVDLGTPHGGSRSGAARCGEPTFARRSSATSAATRCSTRSASATRAG